MDGENAYTFEVSLIFFVSVFIFLFYVYVYMMAVIASRLTSISSMLGEDFTVNIFL